MFAGLGRFDFRERWWILGGAFGVVIVAVLWGTGVFGLLTGGGIGADPNSESSLARAQVEAQLGRDSADVIVLYSSATQTVADPAYAAAVEDDLADLPSSAVESTSSYFTTNSPAMVSADGKTTFALLQMVGDTDEAREASYVLIEPELKNAPDGLTVQVGGSEAIGNDIGAQVQADIVKAEALSMPILLLLLILVFGGLVAASLPLAIGALAVLGSFTALRLITLVTDVSVFSINIVTMLGLGLAIDYALFVVSRFREEIRRNPDVERALIATMQTAGRTVAFSGLTVAVSLASLLLFPQLFLKSMAYGGISAVLIAMVGSLTVLPALLAIIGTRVDRLRVPLRRTDRARHRKANPGFWYRIAHSVMRRPVAYVAVIVPVLLLLGVPFLGVNLGAVDHRVLPEGTQSRTVAEQLAEQFPDAAQDSLYSVVTFGESVTADSSQQRLEAYRKSLLVVPGVDDAVVIDAAANTAQISIRNSYDVQSDEAKALVADVRAVPDPPDSAVLVGGTSAELVDLLDSLGSTLPWMALWMVLATLILLFMAFGSLVLPIKAVLMNVLSLTASFGAIVWIFQDGNLSSWLGFTVTGSVDSAQPILMLAIAFGLSMDYEVFLLSRMREAYVATGDNQTAVATGLQRTGGIITSAALLLIIVFAAFATSGITFIKMIGVGMVLAILIDATVVRTLLVPASMQLLGRANWWAPAPLARFWNRFGLREGDDPEQRERVPTTRHRRRQAQRGSRPTVPMIDLPSARRDHDDERLSTAAGGTEGAAERDGISLVKAGIRSQ